MRRKFFVFPLLAALMLSAAFGTGMRCISATVTQVTDGNSFDATADLASGWGNDGQVQQGDVYHVSLIGIEAPTGDQCYAQQATDYLKNLIEGKKVCLARDIGCRDSSGKLLADVGVSSGSSTMGCDVFVNADMVLQGYARAVAGPHEGMLHWLLDYFQCQAYEAGRGMWGACSDLTPPERCGVQPTATPGPDQTVTPGPPAGTGTPTPSHNCHKKCATGTPCPVRSGPLNWRCGEQQNCNCDGQ